jgi:uncharacterized protein involved in exopolysaccharide biosynthesis
MAEHDFQRAGAGDGFDDEIDLFELVQNLWEDKWLISAISGLAAVASVLVALWLPNIYSASTLLKPQSAEGGLSALASQYGGLASLAGISLPSGDGESKTALAIEVLKSKRFAYDFVSRHRIKPQLMAAERWDWETQQLILDADDFDSARGIWVRKIDAPRVPEPSAEEVHKFWNEEFISISEDKKTSLVSL